MNVIVTGFEAFSGVPSNPTVRIIEALGPPVGTRILPVDTEAVRPTLQDIWASEPDIVLHLGVAERASHIALETRAENIRSFRIPDNAGRTIVDQPVVDGGPALLGSRIPTDVIEPRLRAAGIEASLSRNAGRFLCNQVMYESLFHLPRTAATGFMHVPPDEILAEQLGLEGFMPLTELVRAVELALETTRAWSRPTSRVSGDSPF